MTDKEIAEYYDKKLKEWVLKYLPHLEPVYNEMQKQYKKEYGENDSD